MGKPKGRIPVTAACRVRSCSSHGKSFLDIYRHLRLQHPFLNVTTHARLPAPSDDALRQAAHPPYMKYRAPEFCKVEGCVEKRAVFKDLTRHLRKQHSLTREEYQRKYPKLEGEILYTRYHQEHMSICFPEEHDFYPRLELWRLSDLPETPGVCPIKDEMFQVKKDAQTLPNSLIRDEEKDWFIKKWLNGNEKFMQLEDMGKDQFVKEWLNGKETFLAEDEYPKWRIIRLECFPSDAYLARSMTPFFDKGFDLGERFTVLKKLSSVQEEFYFWKAIQKSEMAFSRFKEGVYEFSCPYCEKFHSALLLNKLYFERQ